MGTTVGNISLWIGTNSEETEHPKGMSCCSGVPVSRATGPSGITLLSRQPAQMFLLRQEQMLTKTAREITWRKWYTNRRQRHVKRLILISEVCKIPCAWNKSMSWMSVMANQLDTSGKKLPPLFWPMGTSMIKHRIIVWSRNSTSRYVLKRIFLITNCCGRVQPTVGGPTPRQVGTVCIRKLAVSELASERHSPMSLLFWFCFKHLLWAPALVCLNDELWTCELK